MIATPLCVIMGKCGSDKGSENIHESHHNYTLFYYKLFSEIQQNALRIFELGLGSNNPNIPSNMLFMGKKCRPGASLYGWEEFFPNANIYGADIDRNILFNTNRIKTYYCDQTNSNSIKELWNNTDLEEQFDIIVEDGLHEYNANVCFFENSIHKLKRGGYYIIEDIINKYIPIWNKKIDEWRKKYTSYEFTIVPLPSKHNNHDNTLILIKYT